MIPILYHKQFHSSIGSEELGHQEIVASIIYQLTKNLTDEEARTAGFDQYFVGHGKGIYPSSAAGVPFSATAIASKGDAYCDLAEDLAADAAITKEQSLSKNRQKPLKYKDFSHFGKTLKNRFPAII